MLEVAYLGFLIFELFLCDPFLLVHQFSLLVYDSLDALLDAVLHLFRLARLCLLIIHKGPLVTGNLLCLLVELGLVLHVFLPEIVEVLLLLLDLDLALGHLVDQLLALALHTRHQLDLLGVLPLQYLHPDEMLLVLVSLDKQRLQQDVYFVGSAQFSEIWLQFGQNSVGGIVESLQVGSRRPDRVYLKLERHVRHEGVPDALRARELWALLVSENHIFTVLVHEIFLVQTLV